MNDVPRTSSPLSLLWHFHKKKSLAIEKQKLEYHFKITKNQYASLKAAPSITKTALKKKKTEHMPRTSDWMQ